MYAVAEFVEFVVLVKNELYGTTAAGGTGCGEAGCGTVFEVKE